MNQKLLLESGQSSNIINESKLAAFDNFNRNQDENLISILKRIHFLPGSTFIITWKFLNLFLIYVFFVEIPIMVTFEKYRLQQSSQIAFEVINTPAIIFFLFGILLKFKTAFYQKGSLISQQKIIIKHYMKYQFILDFLSITSISLFQIWQVSQSSHAFQYRYVVLLFYLKIYEVVKVQNSIIHQFDLHRRIKAILKLIRLLLRIFLICNISACGFFYLSQHLCTTPNQVCWINQYFINKSRLKTQSWQIQYVVSLYWASTTMISIGYGDITPKNIHEVIYTIFMQFGAALIFAYSLNAFWSIGQQLNSKILKIDKRINVINVYMRDKNIKSDLKSRVIGYLMHYYNTKNLRERDMEKQIIQELTPSLRKQLYLQTYGCIFKNSTFFSWFRPHIFQESSTKVFETGLFANQIFSQPFEDVPTKNLHYVFKGKLREFISQGENQIKLGFYESGQVVGLYGFITQLISNDIVKTEQYSMIYSLMFRDWKQIIRSFDQDFQRFYEIRDKVIFENELSKIDISCQFCGRQDHISFMCFHRKIREKYLTIIKKARQFTQRQFLDRNNRIKSNKLSAKSISKSDRNVRKQSFDLPELEITSYRMNRKIFKSGYQSNAPESPKRIQSLKKDNKQKHMKIIKKIVEQNKNQQNQDQSEGLQSEIVTIEVEIDKVKNYERYFSQYNADEERNRQRRQKLMTSLLL